MKKVVNGKKLPSSMLCISTIVFLAFIAPTTFADNNHSAGGPHVLSINSKPFGQSYKEWAIDFSRWSYSIPYSINPVFNGAVTNCTLPQYGMVWFVATGSPNATCEVPNGKAIFVHMGAYVDTYPCPDPNFKPAKGQSLEAFLTADAKAAIDNYISTLVYPNELYIDGKPVVDNTMLPKLRLSTGLFTFTGDLSLQAVDSCVTGKQQKAVADGWFAIIDGLKPGKHKFEFFNSYGGAPNGSMEITIGSNKVKED